MKIYLFVYCSIVLSLFAAAEIFAQSSAYNQQTGDTLKYTLDNCVNTFSMDKAEKTKSGYLYWFAEKNFLDGRTIKLSVVRPHEATHPPHKHAEDEFFFVLEGKAEFYLNGYRKVVGPMTSLYCPSHVEHGINNAGDTDLKYLVIKKYIIK
ncbi:MAG: cupin domain-containing protein [Ignavibacteriaceae bacterium]